MRILLMGDGEWASDSLLRLHEEGHEVAGVVLRTRPTSSALAQAAAAIGAPMFQPADASAPEFLASVAAAGPELILSVAYDQILRGSVLTRPPRGCVNFHAGKLPALPRAQRGELGHHQRRGGNRRDRAPRWTRGSIAAPS